MGRILVVEDDEWYRALLVDILGQDGHEVIEAADRGQALVFLQNSQADLMIVDTLMPNMEGVNTIIELRQLGMTIPIVAISGGWRAVPAAITSQSVHLLGVRASLVKPFSRAALRSALVKAI